MFHEFAAFLYPYAKLCENIQAISNNSKSSKKSYVRLLKRKQIWWLSIKIWIKFEFD